MCKSKPINQATGNLSSKAEHATTGEKNTFEITYPMPQNNEANIPYGAKAINACDGSKNPKQTH